MGRGGGGAPSFSLFYANIMKYIFIIMFKLATGFNNGVVIGENGDQGGIFRSMSFLKWTGKVVKSPKEILFFKIIPSCRYLCCVFSKH